MNQKILYIGLNGYVGSGKDTVAKMLSHILNYTFTDKKSAYASFIKSFNPMDTATYPENVMMSTCFCIGFADQLKEICSNIFQVDIDNFYYNKGNSWICINKDFEFTEIKPDQSKIITAQEYYTIKDTYLHSDDRFYMSLRELLVYVGTYVLQESISREVFINLVNKKINKKKQNGALRYVICTDVRFLHEFDYVKENGGIMINITRDGVSQLDNVAEHDLDDQDDFDYTIENNSDYESLFYQIWDMVQDNVEFKNITYQLMSHDRSDNYIVLKEVREVNDQTHNTYLLKSEYGTSRVCHEDGNIVAIDPSGGPMISVGDYLSNLILFNVREKVERIWFDTIEGGCRIETVVLD